MNKLAEWTGLEPATPGVTGRYSNQLNYHSALEGAHFDIGGGPAQEMFARIVRVLDFVSDSGCNAVRLRCVKRKP